MTEMDRLQTVTYKQLSTIFKVSRRTASDYVKNTKIYYSIKTGVMPKSITLGQVITANRFEE